MEFPHLLPLIEETSSTPSTTSTIRTSRSLRSSACSQPTGSKLFDVEEIPTHGGSLRIYARNEGDLTHDVEPRLGDLRRRELESGLADIGSYDSFADRVLQTKLSVLEFALGARRNGKTIVAYGAAAKGNTLLNYCGLGRDFISYVVDRSPHKQGRFLPGTRIPIYDPARVEQTRPDYLLLLAWNLRDEIIEQMSHVRDFGCRFVTPVPEIRVFG